MLWIFLVALVALALMVLVLFGVRRSQLRRTLGTFEAALKVGSGRWVSGICRYADHRLEFLRLHSLTPIPVYRLARSGLELRGWHQPDSSEQRHIPRGAIVVELDSEAGPLLLGMSYAAYTGLSSWLEAGPVAGVGTWRQGP